MSWQGQKYTQCEPRPSAKNNVRENKATYNHEGLWERLIEKMTPVLNNKKDSTRALKVFTWLLHAIIFHFCPWQPHYCYFKLFHFIAIVKLWLKMQNVYLKKISGDSSPRSTASSLKPGSATRLFVFHFCKILLFLALIVTVVWLWKRKGVLHSSLSNFLLANRESCRGMGRRQPKKLGAGGGAYLASFLHAFVYTM